MGFPGETEADLQLTLNLVKRADFCSAYCFKYSPRETTVAAAMEGKIPEAEIERRHAVLLETVNAQMERHLAEMVGKKVTLLLETETDGQSQYYFKGRLDAPAQPGSLVVAEVIGHSRTALKCRALVPAAD